jgi:hypothetical protein
MNNTHKHKQTRYNIKVSLPHRLAYPKRPSDWYFTLALKLLRASVVVALFQLLPLYLSEGTKENYDWCDRRNENRACSWLKSASCHVLLSLEHLLTCMPNGIFAYAFPAQHLYKFLIPHIWHVSDISEHNNNSWYIHIYCYYLFELQMGFYPVKVSVGFHEIQQYFLKHVSILSS